MMQPTQLDEGFLALGESFRGYLLYFLVNDLVNSVLFYLRFVLGFAFVQSEYRRAVLLACLL